MSRRGSYHAFLKGRAKWRGRLERGAGLGIDATHLRQIASDPQALVWLAQNDRGVAGRWARSILAMDVEAGGQRDVDGS